MKTPKLVNVIIVIALSSGLLSGCGKKPAPSPTATGGIQEKPYDYDNEVLIINDFSVLGRSKVNVRANDLYKGENAHAKRHELEKWQRMQKEYNCTIEFLGNPSLQSGYMLKDINNSVLAGKPIANLHIGHTREITYIFDSNMQIFEPLDRYAQALELGDQGIWDRDMNQALAYDGVTRMVAPHQYHMHFFNGSPKLIFNKTLLKQENLWQKYNLYNLQAKREWNWEIFKALCQKIIKDTDEDGKIDRYAVGASPLSLANSLAIANGNGSSDSALAGIDEDGRLSFDFNQPSKKEALDMVSWLSEIDALRATSHGLIDGDGPTMFNYGKLLFINEHHFSEYNFSEYPGSEEWGIVAYPIGPDNMRQRYYVENRDSYAGGVILKSYKPEVLARVLRDYLQPIYTIEDMIDDKYEELKENYDPTVAQTYLLTADKEAVCNIHQFHIADLNLLVDVCYVPFENQLGISQRDPLYNSVFSDDFTKVYFDKFIDFIVQREPELDAIWQRYRDIMQQDREESGLK